MKKIQIIVFLILAGVIPGICSENSESDGLLSVKTENTLSIAITDNFHPFTFVNAEGKPAGLFVDIWKLWSEKTGHKIEFIVSSWNESLENLKNGRADIHRGLSVTPEREKWLIFSQPFYKNTFCLFFPLRQGKPLPAKELAGKRIGVVRNSSEEEFLKNNYPDIERIAFESTEETVFGAKHGKTAALAASYLSASSIIVRLGLSGEFEVGKEILYTGTFHAPVLKDRKDLLAEIDKGFDAISDNELAEIEKRWIPDPSKRYYRTPGKIRLTAEEESWLKNHKTVRFGFMDGFPPLSFVNNKQYIGIHTDYLKTISERTGLRFEYVPVLPAELDLRGKIREFDMFPSFSIASRKSYADFTDPLMYYKSVIISRSDDPFISGLNALKNKKVTVVKGIKYYDRIFGNYPEIQRIEKKNILECLEDVSNHKADAYVGPQIIACWLIQKHNLVNLKIAGVADYLPEPYMYAVRSDYPELISILNKGIASISKDEHEAILQKWFTVKVEYKADWSEVLKRAGAIGGIFIVILGIILLWNRKMAAEIAQRTRLETALKESELWMKSIFNSLDESVLVVTPDRKIVNVNGATEKIFAYSPAELINRSTEVLHVDYEHYLEFGRRINEAFDRGKSANFEFRIKRKNGEIFPSEHTVSLLKNDKGDAIGIVSIVRDITDRKHAEEALRESEKQFRRMFENHYAVMLLTDPENGKIIRANKAARKYYGYTAEDFERLFIYEINPLGKEEISAEMANAKSEKRNCFYFPHLLANGELRYVEVHSSPVEFKGKTLLFSIIHDITERRQAEQSLRESENRYRLLHESMRDGFAQISMSGHIVSVNPCFLEMTGYSEEEVSILHYNDITPEKWQESEQEIIEKQVIPNGYSDIYEKEYIRKDGSVFPVELRAYLLRDKNGQADGMWAVIRDISDRKRAEELLWKSEKRYRELFEFMEEGVLRADTQGNIIMANIAIAKMCGYISPEEMLGIPMTKLYANPKDREAMIQKVKEKGILKNFEIVARTKDGHSFWALCNVKIIVNENGEVMGTEGLVRDISDRKRAEEELEQAHARLNATLHALPDLLFEVDREGRIYDFHAPQGELLYVHPEAFLSKTIREVLPSDAADIIAHAIAEAAANGQHSGATYMLQMPTGQHWFELSITAKDDPHLSKSRLILLARDITDRKKTEEALRESEERFKNAFQYSPIGIALTSLEGKWLQVNPKVCSIVGYSEDELLTKTFQDITHPEDLETDLNNVRQMLTGEIDTYSMEKRYFHKQGRIIWVLLSVGLVRDRVGTPLYFISQIEDITDRKRAEEELRKIEWLLSSGLKSNFVCEISTYGDLTRLNTCRQISDAVSKNVLFDIAGDYLDLMETSSAIYEINGDYAFGIFSSGWCRLLDTASRNLCNTEDNRAALTGGKWLCHESCWTDCSRLVIETGKPADIECHGGIRLYAVPIFSGEKIIGAMNFGYGEPPRNVNKLNEISEKYGIPVGTLIEQADRYQTRPSYMVEIAKKRLEVSARLIGEIVKNKQTEEQLKNAKEQAESATRAKSEFLASMSHEIRTPLNPIINMTRVLLTTELNPEQQEYVKTVMTSGEILLSLINDILDFSKIEAGKMELEHRDFSVFHILDQVESILGVKAGEKGLRIIRETGPNLPVRLIGDPGRIRQILLNFANNAVKFTAEGTITIRVFSEDQDDRHAHLCFEVADTGTGISPEAMKRLFTPFSQADASVSRKYGGTGLGLAISKQLAELMHGEVSAESEEGKGSVFRFIARFEKSADQTDISESGDCKVSSVFSRKFKGDILILLAEDNIANQKVALAILKQFGLSADTACNGKEAVEALCSKIYALVLMDVQMPETDGLTATKMIRDPGSGVIEPNIPIIAMTANAGREDREKCKSAGMDDYLSKPVSPEELFAVLEKHLRGAEISEIRADSVQEKKQIPVRALDVSDARIFDRDDFLHRIGGNMELFSEIVGVMPGSISEEIWNLKRAVHENNAAAIRLHAHSLKGLAANVSAHSLRAIALRMETAVKEGSMEEMESLTGELDCEFALFESLIADIAG